ncbi:hypothetical protein CAPN004_23730 [Capnocytophaga cynodegmi]|uniref:hypothetical protein n=1 Tax=Capnocytophaga cynodegmi TaxID=28189 RepID=UPI001AC669AB|nr:hypothetical protein [Capnocytophaga cynodegmi]GIM53344.1 hypothetical protein CAPN004_23730 [Capnocytophaga cynodegmi]
MDFDKIILDTKDWFLNLNKFKEKNIIFIEEKNFEGIRTFTINIEDNNNLGIIIIYRDNYLFFDFLSKNDEQMKSYNWSDNFTDLEDIKEKILNSIEQYWL